MVAGVWLGTAAAQTGTFSNSGSIPIADGGICGPGPGFDSLAPGKGTPYPSPIVVSGLVGNVTDVNASITGLTHSFPDDVDVLLVGPTGAKTLLMADVGDDPKVSNVNLAFDDAAANSLPDTTQLTSGTYKPTAGTTGTGDGCHLPTSFPSPAPAGPYGTSLGAFNGTAPNGT